MYDKLRGMQASGELTVSGWAAAERTCNALFDKRTTDRETKEKLTRLADEGLYVIHQKDRQKQEREANVKPATRPLPKYVKDKATPVKDVKKVKQTAWRKKHRDQERNQQWVGTATSQPTVAMDSLRLPRQRHPSNSPSTMKSAYHQSGGVRYQQGVHDLNETQMHCDEYEGRMYRAMRQRQDFSETFQARGHGDNW